MTADDPTPAQDAVGDEREALAAHDNESFVLDEDFDAQADFLRSLGLDPDTATHAELFAALNDQPTEEPTDD